MPKSSLALVLSLGLFALGCGEDVPPPMPDPVLGNYLVSVESNGRLDENIPMTVVLGASSNVLMDFVFGFSQIRGVLEGSTKLTIPRQVISANHSTGPAEGVATGDGTFAETTVDFTIRLVTPGFGPADGGSGLGGMGTVEYKVVGTKN